MHLRASLVQASVAGSSSGDSIHQSLLQLEALSCDFSAVLGLAGGLAGTAAAAEATAAEYRRLVDGLPNPDPLWQRCLQDVGIGD
jgi:hypothetical protein